ncbi:glycine cleavage system protein T [Halobacteriales archaeon QH_10_67_22]|nr:MAG: glycine cleavage system protein T [Halobacteriales archaeon QH_10_67_22]
MALRQSPLSAAHESATLTEFGGWEMPVEFDSIRTEHEAVRESVGRFDVSHMGQLLVGGADAARVTDRLVTNDVRELAPGQACYAAITDADGVMLDDTVVDRWDIEATVTNATESLGMIAVQGPDAPGLLAGETDADLGDLDRFETTVAEVAGATALVARTGYTGERGFELIVPREAATTVWTALDCQPCGLGARDTLRLEMGFLLSGQEFHPEENPRTPHEAGIGFTVALDREFVGRDALEGVSVEGPGERLRGLELINRGVPREGYPVTTRDGDRLGTVTSGTMSPTLDRGIGLAYLPTEVGPGDTVRIEIREEPKKARVTTTPFLDR